MTLAATPQVQEASRDGAHDPPRRPVTYDKRHPLRPTPTLQSIPASPSSPCSRSRSGSARTPPSSAWSTRCCLKPLPFPAPEELVAIGGVDLSETASPPRLYSFCFPDFVDFREQNRSFSSMAVYRDRTVALVDEKGAQSVRGEKVSGEFFDVLGIKPILGRGFTRADEQAGGGPGGLKVVLSYGFWQSHFNRADDVIGRVLMLDGRPNTVIGVMPEGFQFPIQTDAARALHHDRRGCVDSRWEHAQNAAAGQSLGAGNRPRKNGRAARAGERGTADDRGGAGKKVSGHEHQIRRRIAAAPR